MIGRLEVIARDCHLRDMTLVALLGTIYPMRNHEKLSSAIRLFVLGFYREQLALEERYDAIKTVLPSSIRGKAASDSDGKRPPIPIEGGHLLIG